jgi:hypothetical protein
MAAHLTAALHAMLAGLTLTAATGHAQTESSAFDHAMQAYSVQHYRRAFDGLARLADAGDAEAARIALLMVAHGPRLFGEPFDVTSSQRALWLEHAWRLEVARAAGPARTTSAR